MGEDDGEEVEDAPEREDLVGCSAHEVEADLAVLLSWSSHGMVGEGERERAATSRGVQLDRTLPLGRRRRAAAGQDAAGLRLARHALQQRASSRAQQKPLPVDSLHSPNSPRPSARRANQPGRSSLSRPSAHLSCPSVARARTGVSGLGVPFSCAARAQKFRGRRRQEVPERADEATMARSSTRLALGSCLALLPLAVFARLRFLRSLLALARDGPRWTPTRTRPPPRLPPASSDEAPTPSIAVRTARTSSTRSHARPARPASRHEPRPARRRRRRATAPRALRAFRTNAPLAADSRRLRSSTSSTRLPSVACTLCGLQHRLVSCVVLLLSPGGLGAVEQR